MILIANIGNRNLKFDNLTFAEISSRRLPEWPSGKDFREFTRSLLLHPDDRNSTELRPEFRQRVSVQIIDLLYNKLSNTEHISKVLLLGSNQKESILQRGQDTIFAARIAAGLLSAQFKCIAEMHSIDHVNITRDADLLRFYRSFINGLKRNYPGEVLVFCDAGGAPQQKMAMKIMAEFMLKEDQYRVFYVPQPVKGAQPDPEEVGLDEYRSIITCEQARKLAAIGEYMPALRLFGLPENQITCPPKNYQKLLLFGHLRMAGSHDKTRKLIAASGSQLIPVYHELGYNPTAETEKGGDALTSQDLFQVRERLLKTDFLYSADQFNHAVMAMQQFIEEFLELALWRSFSHVPGWDEEGRTRKESGLKRRRRMNNLQQYLMENSVEYQQADRWFMEQMQKLNAGMKAHGSEKNVAQGINPDGGLPFHIAAVAATNNAFVNKVLRIFAPHLSNNHLTDTRQPGVKLNDLRNHIAHRGKQIHSMKDEYPRFADLLNELKAAFALQDLKPYAELNRQIDLFMERDS